LRGCGCDGTRFFEQSAFLSGKSKTNCGVTPVGAFFQELLKVDIYKRSQGRITRQVTFAAMALVFAIGFYRMFELLNATNIDTEKSWQLTVSLLNSRVDVWLPGILALVFVWVSYRLVNLPSFADFLIAVEAELNKVSWPTMTELVRASIVVLISLVTLASVIFVFDRIWLQIFHWIGLY
jgi:preprotein translocase subunit SecE